MDTIVKHVRDTEVTIRHYPAFASLELEFESTEHGRVTVDLDEEALLDSLREKQADDGSCPKDLAYERDLRGAVILFSVCVAAFGMGSFLTAIGAGLLK